MTEIQDLRFVHANISKRFKNALLSDFNEQTAKEATDFINSSGWRCLIVLGPTGTGKTHLSAAMAREFCKTANCYYTTAYGMSQQIIEDRNAKFFEKQSMLFIDEVNRGYETKAEKNRFFDLVNNYYNDEKPLVLLGNDNIEDTLNAVGAAVADRLKENLTALILTGKTRRAK